MSTLTKREKQCLLEMSKHSPYYWMPNTVTRLVQLGYAKETESRRGFELTAAGTKLAEQLKLGVG